MSLALNEQQFSMFIQFLKSESRGNLAIKKAVSIVGQQRDESVWVLGKELQVDAQGRGIPRDEQKFTWLDTSVQESLGAISLAEVLPTIQTPLSTTVLHELVTVLHTIMRHNFIASILMIGGAVMSLHYRTILESTSYGCPTIIAQGPCQTGKSTSIAIALSLFGR